MEYTPVLCYIQRQLGQIIIIIHKRSSFAQTLQTLAYQEINQSQIKDCKGLWGPKGERESSAASVEK